ncbi:MAG: hypothetical protein KKA84_12005 [Bacteroidetes bacterium]|nr:hypothetical protein [Bacteroidota bacterium]
MIKGRIILFSSNSDVDSFLTNNCFDCGRVFHDPIHLANEKSEFKCALLEQLSTKNLKESVISRENLHCSAPIALAKEYGFKPFKHWKCVKRTPRDNLSAK